MFETMFDRGASKKALRTIKDEVQDLWERRYKLKEMHCLVPRFKLIGGCWYIAPCHPVRRGEKEFWADFSEDLMKIWQ